MRKADYALLADAIKNRIADARTMAIGEPTPGGYHTGKADALRGLAVDFAARASVDKAEFLKACGIE